MSIDRYIRESGWREQSRDDVEWIIQKEKKKNHASILMQVGVETMARVATVQHKALLPPESTWSMWKLDSVTKGWWSKGLAMQLLMYPDRPTSMDDDASG